MQIIKDVINIISTKSCNKDEIQDANNTKLCNKPYK